MATTYSILVETGPLKTRPPLIAIDGAKWIRVTVDSAQRWTMGDLECDACGPRTLPDDGELRLREIRRPDGWVTRERHSFPRGALVLGMLEDSASTPRQYVMVGTQLVAPILYRQDGCLGFYLWDDQREDNVGSLLVDVQLFADDNEFVSSTTLAGPGKPFTIDAWEHAFLGGQPLDTGIDVQVGQGVHIRARADARWGNNKRYLRSPNGWPWGSNSRSGPNFWAWGRPSGFFEGSVVATLDEGATYFPVGSHLDMLAPRDGRLKLLSWSGRRDDCARRDPAHQLLEDVRAWCSGEPRPRGGQYQPPPRAARDDDWRWFTGVDAPRTASGSPASIVVDFEPSGELDRECVILRNESATPVELRGLRVEIPTAPTLIRDAGENTILFAETRMLARGLPLHIPLRGPAPTFAASGSAFAAAGRHEVVLFDPQDVEIARASKTKGKTYGSTQTLLLDFEPVGEPSLDRVILRNGGDKDVRLEGLTLRVATAAATLREHGQDRFSFPAGVELAVTASTSVLGQGSARSFAAPTSLFVGPGTHRVELLEQAQVIAAVSKTLGSPEDLAVDFAPLLGPTQERVIVTAVGPHAVQLWGLRLRVPTAPQLARAAGHHEFVFRRPRLLAPGESVTVRVLLDPGEVDEAGELDSFASATSLFPDAARSTVELLAGDRVVASASKDLESFRGLELSPRRGLRSSHMTIMNTRESPLALDSLALVIEHRLRFHADALLQPGESLTLEGLAGEYPISPNPGAFADADAYQLAVVAEDQGRTLGRFEGVARLLEHDPAGGPYPAPSPSFDYACASPHKFHRLITPGWLKRHAARFADPDHELDAFAREGLALTVPAHDRLRFHEPLLRVAMLGPGQLPAEADPTIHVTVGLRYLARNPAEAADPQAYSRLAFILAQAATDSDPLPSGYGFELRDPGEFADWGPYRGVEAFVARYPGVPLTRDRTSFIPDDRGNLGALEVLDEPDEQALAHHDAELAARYHRHNIPERIEITIRPKFAWARCASAVQGGHTVSVAPFFQILDLSRGCYLDVYGSKTGDNFYAVHFIELSLSCS